ncbi:MAG TPA: hypothetical protein DDZ80_14540 [Cyanobacteria bacterium UBA8803]|nr:hypothetical protein [Cyanobacteria bacterium UBA9273]HBL59651.1 hypothetical protein [Cyanobacteria bacterium UBA8803]
MTNSTAQITGTENEQYNLISVLYHLLNGATTYNKYIQDAEQSGDRELAEFFREIQQQSTQCADRAKELLTRRMGERQAVAT